MAYPIQLWVTLSGLDWRWKSWDDSELSHDRACQAGRLHCRKRRRPIRHLCIRPMNGMWQAQRGWLIYRCVLQLYVGVAMPCYRYNNKKLSYRRLRRETRATLCISWKYWPTVVRITQTDRVSAWEALSATVTFYSATCVIVLYTHRCTRHRPNYRTASMPCHACHRQTPVQPILLILTGSELLLLLQMPRFRWRQSQKGEGAPYTN